MEYFIGIDIGTQGARMVLLNQSGEVIVEKGEDFLLNERSREEQSPKEWTEITFRILKLIVEEVKSAINLNDIKAIAVTSTSGTVIPLNKENRPIHNALMYSDKRAEEVVSFCKSSAEEFFKGKTLSYTGFNASSGICKMVWFQNNFPEKMKKLSHWVHAADFISGQLTGRFDISDETNSLKSGFDIFTRSWPEYIFKNLSIKKEWLPKVVPAGTPIGTLKKSVAKKLGLSDQIQIVAGMTDGCASQIASGAVGLGEWNTTIGTTMVIKGVTEKPVVDPQGRLYNHRHPEGYYMPGGAGNTGADWVTLDFKNKLNEYTERANKGIPSGYISWPLKTQGERFPIMAPQARGFEPSGLTKQEQFNANMEGVAYLEKYAYEMINELSGEEISTVYTAGGGSNSDVWLRIRSNVLGLPIFKMKYTSGAVGAAILAASKTSFSSLTEATKALTKVEKIIKPEKRLSLAYENYYKNFLSKLEQKEYI